MTLRPAHPRAKRSTPPSPSAHTKSGAREQRQGDSKTLLHADTEHYERMFEQISRVALEFGGRFGIDAQAAQRIFARAARAAQHTPYRLTEAVQFQTLLQISDILGAWYREPAFLNEDSAPRALPLTGPKSFATLAQRFLPQFEPRQVANVLVTEGVLTQNAAGEVLPLRRTAAFATPNPMMLDRIPALTQAFMGTLGHNFDPESRSEGTHCERGTTIDRFPTSAIPAFTHFVKGLAQALINSVDEWAARYQVSSPETAREDVARVGVEIFTYAEPHRAPPPEKSE